MATGLDLKSGEQRLKMRGIDLALAVLGPSEGATLQALRAHSQTRAIEIQNFDPRARSITEREQVT